MLQKISKRCTQRLGIGLTGKSFTFSMWLFISICLMIVQNVSVSAQSDSLSYYLELAARNNPSVQQKFIEYQAALKKIPQVGSLSDPELSLGVFLKPMELVSGNQVADIRLMQMFPWFGVLRNAKDEMSLMANAKYEVFLDARLQLSYEVQRSYYNLYKIQKEIDISEKNIEILKTVERLSLARFRSASTGSTGSVTSGNNNMASVAEPVRQSGSLAMGSMDRQVDEPVRIQESQPALMSSMASSADNYGLVDLYSLRIETGELENRIALLEDNKNSEIARFNSYLNRLTNSAVFIADTLITETPEVSLIAISDSINVRNPMLMMLKLEKQAAESKEKMVTAMGYPMIGLGINYSLIEKTGSGMADPEMNGNDMIMPMLTVTLPVYRKKYRAMAEETDLLKQAAALKYNETANSLQTDYYTAMGMYNDAMRRIKLYASQEQLISQSFDIILRNFSASTAGMTDLLGVREQMLNYELKKVEAIVDLNISIAWLKRLGSL